MPERFVNLPYGLYDLTLRASFISMERYVHEVVVDPKWNYVHETCQLGHSDEISFADPVSLAEVFN